MKFIVNGACLKLRVMSRKPAAIKIIDLEDGMPKVEEARLRMEHELHVAKRQGYAAVKLIHGYGSSGVGGALRIELQKELARLAGAGTVQAFIAGENWRLSDEATWPLLQRYPEWKQDRDLGKGNKGITVVLL
jgi:DNA-nicking Smr family endonuclease